MTDHHTVSFNCTNYYLLECKGGFLLIDAGWVGQYETFKRKLTNLGLDVRFIRFVLVTHHHHDHTALIQRIRNDTNCRLIVHKDEVGYMKDGITHTADTRQFNVWLNLLDKVVSPFVKYRYEPIEFTKDDVIVGTDDVDISALTGIHGSIVHTPGHSRGSISLVLANGKSFVGDVAMNALRLFGQQYRPIEAESYRQVYRSWARLMEKGARIVYPSHGKGFRVEEFTRILGPHNKPSEGTR